MTGILKKACCWDLSQRSVDSTKMGQRNNEGAVTTARAGEKQTQSYPSLCTLPWPRPRASVSRSGPAAVHNKKWEGKRKGQLAAGFIGVHRPFASSVG